MSGILTPAIKKYLDNMQPGTILKVWEQRYPIILIHAAKEYIAQGGQLEFSNDYEQLKKL
ncbi:hypothetical protein SAMN05421821_105162 [Mucilaginibacter lappiensis]|uniref:TusA-related sulfurtransferase n=1 Tax=Mucilaginibacter lappiensis TaxID=354630 RepID=A0ABR6PIZ6_9SPHI|nr:hypothetical protein [Mucilaginibacter lappiensis]MBB6109744.1 TusA-related sulfurtransferase [Mucilaginibacter lappiensis]SIR13957.1 hypothetical protein SAMN05421821_105162 [Mucilaginibacter lappiensis]